MAKRPPSSESIRLGRALAPANAALKQASGLTVVSALGWVFQALAVAWMFSLLLDHRLQSWQIAAGVGAFVAVGILRALFDVWADRVVTRAADRVLALERAQLIKAQSTRTKQAGAQTPSAAIAALVGEKLESLRPYLTQYRPARLRAMVVPLVFLALAASISWAVALIFLMAGPLVPLFMALVGMAAQDASERQMDEISTINALLMERLQALVDIRLLDAPARMVAQFRTRAEALRARTMAVLRIAFLSSAVLELFAALGIAMVAVYVGFSLLGSLKFGTYGTPLSIGEGIFLLMLAPAFFQPLRDVAAAWHDKAAAAAVMRDLLTLEGQPGRHILGTGGSAAVLPGPATVSVRGLRVTRDGRAPLCYPDFSILAGQSIAFIGPSGAGKSTLIAVLAGLLAPDDGGVRVAGQPLDNKTADGWRARIGWVPQAPHFFATSLQQNLAMTRVAVNPRGVHRAVALAAASDVVARLEHGLLTRLGEVGTGVSGGEARRLMVARAAYGHIDVVLADEPTADLDRPTAELVTEGLLKLSRVGATLIVATHDMRLAARMQRQIELRQKEGV